MLRYLYCGPYERARRCSLVERRDGRRDRAQRRFVSPDKVQLGSSAAGARVAEAEAQAEPEAEVDVEAETEAKRKRRRRQKRRRRRHRLQAEPERRQQRLRLRRGGSKPVYEAARPASLYGRDGVSGAGGANPNPSPNAVAWLGQAGRFGASQGGADCDVFRVRVPLAAPRAP